MSKNIDPWQLLREAITYLNENCDNARASPEWECFCDVCTEVRNLRCDIYEALDKHDQEVNNDK